MVSQQREPILRVRLEGDLSLGQLGGLFRDLQTAVRASATVLDKPPPYRSVRLSEIRPGSLVIVAEVLGWDLHLVLDTGRAIVAVATNLAPGIASGVLGNVIWELLKRGRERKHQEVPTGQLDEIANRLNRLEEVVAQGVATFDDRPTNQPAGRRARRRLVEDIAGSLNANPDEVEAAVASVEAIARSARTIAISGGGGIAAPRADVRATIPPRQR